MKNKLKILVLIVALSIVPIISGLTLVGCANKLQTTTRVAGTVTTTVDAAMSAWGDYVRQNKATVEERIRVRTAYINYQTSMAAAEKLAVAVLTQPANEPEYKQAVSVMSQASSELIALVNTFINKPKTSNNKTNKVTL